MKLLVRQLLVGLDAVRHAELELDGVDDAGDGLLGHALHLETI